MNICIGCLYRSKPTEEGVRTCAVTGMRIDNFISAGSTSCSARVDRDGPDHGGE